MGRKAKFGDDVLKRVRELRARGMVTEDIREVCKRDKLGVPSAAWINEATRDIEAKVASAEQRATDLVDEVSSDGEDKSTEYLLCQLQRLSTLQEELKGNPGALSQLSGAIVRTVTLIDKRRPVPPPEKEIPPEWEAIGAAGIARMHSLLDRVLEQNGQSSQNLPSKT